MAKNLETVLNIHEEIEKYKQQENQLIEKPITSQALFTLAGIFFSYQKQTLDYLTEEFSSISDRLIKATKTNNAKLKASLINLRKIPRNHMEEAFNKCMKALKSLASTVNQLEKEDEDCTEEEIKEKEKLIQLLTAAAEDEISEAKSVEYQNKERLKKNILEHMNITAEENN